MIDAIFKGMIGFAAAIILVVAYAAIAVIGLTLAVIFGSVYLICMGLFWISVEGEQFHKRHTCKCGSWYWGEGCMACKDQYANYVVVDNGRDVE